MPGGRNGRGQAALGTLWVPARTESPSSHPPAEGGGRRAGALSLSWPRGTGDTVKAGAVVRGHRRRIPRETYRNTARAVGIAPRLRKRTGPLDAAILILAAAFLILTGPVVGSSVSD